MVSFLHDREIGYAAVMRGRGLGALLKRRKLDTHEQDSFENYKIKRSLGVQDK